MDAFRCLQALRVLLLAQAALVGRLCLGFDGPVRTGGTLVALLLVHFVWATGEDAE